MTKSEWRTSCDPMPMLVFLQGRRLPTGERQGANEFVLIMEFADVATLESYYEHPDVIAIRDQGLCAVDTRLATLHALLDEEHDESRRLAIRNLVDQYCTDYLIRRDYIDDRSISEW